MPEVDVVGVFALCLGRLEVRLEGILDKAERGSVSAIGEAASTDSMRTPLAAFVTASGGTDPRDPARVARNTGRLATLAKLDSYKRTKSFSGWDEPWFFATRKWVLSQDQQFTLLKVPADIAQRIWRVAVCHQLVGDVEDLLPELDGVVSGVSPEAVLESGCRIFRQISHLTMYDSQRQQVEFTPSRLYSYAGPLDRELRHFCRKLVGRVFSGDEIAAMKNEAGLDVFWTGGGWGCRHLWLPVSQFSDQVEWHECTAAREVDSALMVIRLRA